MNFRNHARRTPDRPAVIMASSGAALGYGELEARANRLAHRLRRLGLRRGDHVALFMENNLRFAEVAAAASRSGLYYTPVNSHLTAGEAATIVDDSGSTLVFTTTARLDVAAEVAAHCPGVRQWYVVDGAAPALARFGDYDAAVAAEPDHPIADEESGLALMYSSGTTGRPKGIARPLPVAHPEQRTDWARFGRALMRFRPGMAVLVPAPLYHAAPHAALASSLELGGTAVVMERFDPEAFLACVERLRITHVQVVPTMLTRLLKLPAEIRARYDLSSLEAVVHSAAPCPVTVKEAAIDWLGPIVHEYYGATESYGFTRCTAEEWLAHRGTVGRPVGGELLILDEAGHELGPGQIGEVWFRAPSTGTATVGDVGWVDEDGYLYLTDRKTFMILSGGVNIYPREIEDVLVDHPAVADVAVIGIPDDDFGEQVKAIVVLEPGHPDGPDTEAALITHCRRSLAGFKCPRSVDFADSLPRLESGKLAKHLVRAPYWEATV
jgi:long-chain acyl-CoA synthetase